MADFPVEPFWLRSLIQESPDLDDRRAHLNDETAGNFYELFGINHPPAVRVAQGWRPFTPDYVTIPRYQRGDRLQEALGLPDLLRYRPDAVSPVVISLRDAQRVPQRVPLPRPRPYGGK